MVMPRRLSSEAPSEDHSSDLPAGHGTGRAVRLAILPPGLISLLLVLVLAASYLLPGPEEDDRSSKTHSTLLGHSGQVNSVAITPDGRTIASGGDDHTVVLWDMETRRERLTLDHEAPVYVLAFSPDGKTLATGGPDGIVRLWDVATGHELRRLAGATKGIRALSFAPDGKTLASAGWDGVISLWDPADGRMHHSLRGHTGVVNTLGFSPDGQTLASGATDMTVRLWDLATCRELAAVSGNEDVRTLAFSPEGKRLATGSWSGQVTLRDAATGRAQILPRDQPGERHVPGVLCSRSMACLGQLGQSPDTPGHDRRPRDRRSHMSRRAASCRWPSHPTAEP